MSAAGGRHVNALPVKTHRGPEAPFMVMPSKHEPPATSSLVQATWVTAPVAGSRENGETASSTSETT